MKRRKTKPSWLDSKFKPYCEKNNIHLLKEDFAFIKEMLEDIPAHLQKSVMAHYVEIWLLTMSECKNNNARDNYGRRHANAYLRAVANHDRHNLRNRPEE